MFVIMCSIWETWQKNDFEFTYDYIGKRIKFLEVSHSEKDKNRGEIFFVYWKLAAAPLEAPVGTLRKGGMGEGKLTPLKNFLKNLF